MKKTQILIASLILISLYSCEKSSDPDNFFPSEVYSVASALTKSFDSLNTEMAVNATAIAQNATDTAGIRNRMLTMFNHSSFVMEFSFITPVGIMQIIEPAIYHPFQGSDISQQDHVVKAYQTKLPVLSKQFEAVEGFYGVVDIHPVVNQSEIMGGITALFRPETILDRIIFPMIKNQPFDMFVMEKGGTMIYDQDSTAIGQNLINDSIFLPFPELMAAARLIDASNTGQTTYTYFQTGTTNKVVKAAYWITYKLYGNEWKIVWLKPVNV